MVSSDTTALSLDLADRSFDNGGSKLLMRLIAASARRVWTAIAAPVVSCIPSL
jgi:hypothetical protein